MNHYEPGRYVFRIKEQGWTETKEKKLPMLVFEGYPTHLVRTDPEGNEQLEEVYEDPRFPTRTLRLVVDSSNETMMDFAIKKLRYAGFQGNSFADLNLVNKDIRTICEEGEYKGKTVEQWDFDLPPFERQELNPIDKSTTRKLDTLFGKRLKENATPQQEELETPEPHWINTEANEEDEVPF